MDGDSAALKDCNDAAMVIDPLLGIGLVVLVY